jgi:hypothetical protein
MTLTPSSVSFCIHLARRTSCFGFPLPRSLAIGRSVIVTCCFTGCPCLLVGLSRLMIWSCFPLLDCSTQLNQFFEPKAKIVVKKSAFRNLYPYKNPRHWQHPSAQYSNPHLQPACTGYPHKKDDLPSSELDEPEWQSRA